LLKRFKHEKIIWKAEKVSICDFDCSLMKPAYSELVQNSLNSFLKLTNIKKKRKN
jgi:hypothetical protein